MKIYVSRYKIYYVEKIVPFFIKYLGYKNIMCVPKIIKIVLNVTFSNSLRENNLIRCIRELEMVTFQKPFVLKAKKSISEFGIKKNMNLGLKITLRNNNMYDFIDRLVNLYCSNMKNFCGFSINSFDSSNNFSIGINNSSIFLELTSIKNISLKGLNITLHLNSKSLNESIILLKTFNFVFKENV